MAAMSSPSVFHGLQSSEENRENIHGLYFINGASNTVLDGAPWPPVTYAKHRQSTNSNLDMCTENLGCETGAMCSVYELEMASVKTKINNKNTSPRSAPPPDFPPPLTTLGGEGRLRLGRKREEGRLLLIPFKTCALKSERSGGRLLLRILPAKEADEGRAGEEEEKALGNKDEFGVEEKGFFLNGSGGKHRMSGRCKEGKRGGVGRKKMGAAAIFNCDSFWVPSS